MKYLAVLFGLIFLVGCNKQVLPEPTTVDPFEQITGADSVIDVQMKAAGYSFVFYAGRQDAPNGGYRVARKISEAAMEAYGHGMLGHYVKFGDYNPATKAYDLVQGIGVATGTEVTIDWSDTTFSFTVGVKGNNIGKVRLDTWKWGANPSAIGNDPLGVFPPLEIDYTQGDPSYPGHVLYPGSIGWMPIYKKGSVGWVSAWNETAKQAGLSPQTFPYNPTDSLGWEAKRKSIK